MSIIKKIFKKSKRLLKKVLKKIYTLIFCDPYHRLKNKWRNQESQILHHVYDARELFFQENDISGFNRYDMIVRLLAIENYYGKNNFGWDLYRKQQNTRKAEEWEGAESRFRALIKSYEDNGYDVNSEIQIGSDLRIWDGSHRMALAMYHKHYKISCKVMPSSRPIYYGINWYHENGFTLEEIERIHNRYLQLKEEIQIPFICTLWAPVAPYYDEIVERLKLICEVESYTDYSFDEFNYAQMARKVYAVDDIEKWKIEKKIEYMRQNVLEGQWKIRVVKLKLNTPRFRRKDSTQNTLSQECEDIKRIIRNCYKDKLPNYFHDIICHIGDNFYQNEFIANLFEYRKLDVSAVIEAIKPFNYVLTKTDVPYMQDEFPQSYPLGKDMDVICAKSDYHKICETIVNTLTEMGLPYELREVNKSDAHRLIRIECGGELIYQFDIASVLEDIKDGFVEHVLERKVRAGKYFIPHKSDELILRIYEIMHNNSKKHHIEYVQQHVDDFEASIGEEYLSPMAREIWNSIMRDANSKNPMEGG